MARYAIYFAPAVGSALWAAGEGWLDQPEIAPLVRTARRYGFHATLKAPMQLRTTPEALLAAVAAFAGRERAVALDGLAPRISNGHLVLSVEPQPAALSALAARIVTALEPHRAPLDAAARAKRVAEGLSARQAELLDLYGYPHVLEQFQFHMTLSDALADGEAADLLAAAEAWFAPALAVPVRLDRLVVYAEPEPGAPFTRLTPDHLLG
jgi:hypothetical protein